MTVRATDSNARPQRREIRALERRKIMIEKNTEAGMSEEEATEQANKAMRDNPTGDWRKG